MYAVTVAGGGGVKEERRFGSELQVGLKRAGLPLGGGELGKSKGRGLGGWRVRPPATQDER